MTASSAFVDVSLYPFFSLLEMSDSVEHKLKNLLLKAWRERWSDIVWGIYVKEVMLPLSSSVPLISLSLVPRSFHREILAMLTIWLNVF